MEKLSPVHKIIAGLLLVIFAVRLLVIIDQKSAGFDEVIYPAAGYTIFHKLNYNINRENPPLAKLITAFPLLFYRLKIPEIKDYPADHPFYHFVYGNRFLEENNLSAQKILFLSRLSIVLISGVFGFLLFYFTARLFSPLAGLITLFGYSFSPNVLAYSSLATTDLLIAFWWFIFVIWLMAFIGEIKVNLTEKQLLLVGGIIFGLALGTKFSAFVFLVFFAGVMFFEHYRRNISWDKILNQLAILILVGAIVVLLVYGVIGIGSFFAGLGGILPLVTSGVGSGMTYLFKKVSPTGWWYYYIFVFLIKLPPATVILSFWSIVYIWRKKMLKNSPAIFYLILTIVIIFLSLSFSAYQTGIRFFLPVIPFLWMLLGAAVDQMISEGETKPVLIFLGVFYIFSSLNAHPAYLSYISELFGGSRYGYRYLADSNIDWGTELPALKKYLEKNGNPKILLAYYGNNDPKYYGIEFAELAERSRIKGNAVFYDNWDDILLVVSANNLTSAYYPPTFDFFHWLWEKKPLTVVGGSFYVYKLDADVYSLKKIAELYISQNRLAEAIVAYKRIISLELTEDNLMRLAEIYYNLGDKKETRFYLEKILSINPQNILARDRLKDLK